MGEIRDRLQERYGRVSVAPVIMPNPTKPARAHPFSDAEFETALKTIKAERDRAGLPATDTTMIACQEKAKREKAAEARSGGGRKPPSVASNRWNGKLRVDERTEDAPESAQNRVC